MKRNPGTIKSLTAAIFVAARPPASPAAGAPAAPAVSTPRTAAELDSLRRIVLNAAEEPSIVLSRVDESSEQAFGYNAANGEYGNLLLMGVIDPAKVTRLALQNAGSIASLILTTDCMIATLAARREGREPSPAGGMDNLY